MADHAAPEYVKVDPGRHRGQATRYKAHFHHRAQKEKKENFFFFFLREREKFWVEGRLDGGEPQSPLEIGD